MSSQLLKEAVARVKALPDEEQDRAAEILIAFTSETLPYSLTHEQIEGIEHAIDEADQGRFAKDADLRRIFGRL